METKDKKTLVLISAGWPSERQNARKNNNNNN